MVVEVVGARPTAHASGAGWIPDDRGRKSFPEKGWQELQWHFLPCGAACDDDGVERESFGPDGLLDYPQYTRPAAFRGMEVPDVLLSGNHAEIEAWRRRQALERTKRRRPDLLGPDLDIAP